MKNLKMERIFGTGDERFCIACYRIKAFDEFEEGIETCMNRIKIRRESRERCRRRTEWKKQRKMQ